jgi:hypothetical protein
MIDRQVIPFDRKQHTGRFWFKVQGFKSGACGGIQDFSLKV